MVRNLKNETILIDDATVRSTTSTSYVTVASYNITLTAKSILLYSYEIKGSAANYMYARLKIGTVYIGGEPNPSTDYTLVAGVFALDAGSYTVELQLRTVSASNAAYVRNFRLGRVSFSDASALSLQAAGTTSISLSSRKTCIGTTIRGVIIIQVYATSVPTVSVDGVTLSPIQTGEKYVYSYICALNSNHTVYVSTGSFAAVYSPWFTHASDGETVSLSFPQGSTLYVVTEPLFANPTKSIKIGKKRIASFGDAVDYFYTASGVDRLTAAYTFEVVEVEKSQLFLSGLGGCVSIIGVDVR
ncbi:MAG: hypothetical protein QW334_00275 [Thermofilum sp.]